MRIQTDELISLLSADERASGPSLAGRLMLFLLAGLVASALLFALLFEPRTDLVAAAGTVRFQLKLSAMLLLFVGAGVMALRLARPAAGLRGAVLATLVVPAALLMAVAGELSVTPVAEWSEMLLGHDWRACVLGIVVLALPLLALALLALREGAPAQPALAGAAAGLIAGGAAAALYAVHCPDDSPLFVAAWYTIAVGLVALAGAALGARLLRW